MSLAKYLLDDEFIKDYRKGHGGAEKLIAKAAQYMEDKNWDEAEAMKALVKILPALTNRRLKVFFSYKVKDKETAKTIVQVLRKASARKLKITYMEDFPKEFVGKPWRDEILRGVYEANWFILLLPDPREDWDWCLYETGLFERDLTKADRLLCLHHPDVDLPKAIGDYQGIAADFEHVKKFLEMIFVEENPIPGMEAINKDIVSDIPSYAKEIVDAIHPPSKERIRQRFPAWVKLQAENAVDLQTEEDLDAATILDANPKALSLFGKTRRPDTWKDLRSNIKEFEGDDRWRKELVSVIRRVVAGDEHDPIHAIFQNKKGKIFRPILFALDRHGEDGHIIAFHINFIEDVAAIDVKGFPKKIATLVNLLRMAIRFRWEVLEPFTEHELVEDDFQNLMNSIHRIEQDSRSRGLVNKQKLLKLFTDQDLVRITEMFDRWEKIRNEKTGEGTLDIAIKQEDGQEVYNILHEMILTNQEFLKISAKRFSEVVSGQE